MYTNPMNNDQQAVPIAIAAEEPILRYGIRRLLETEPDLRVVGEAANSSDAIRMVLDLKPEVLLLDVSAALPALEVLSCLALVKSTVRTVLLAPFAAKSQLADAFNLGARGVMLKGSETRSLLSGLRSVIAGHHWIGEKAVTGRDAALHAVATDCNDNLQPPQHYRLTPRELDIVASIANGCSNRDAGRRFSISERTVKHHLTNIYCKLGVSNRLELAVFAVNHRLGVYPSPASQAPEIIEAEYAEVG